MPGLAQMWEKCANFIGLRFARRCRVVRAGASHANFLANFIKSAVFDSAAALAMGRTGSHCKSSRRCAPGGIVERFDIGSPNRCHLLRFSQGTMGNRRKTPGWL